MNFEKLSKEGKKFQVELFGKLSAMGFTVALNGTEYTHPEFIAGLRNSEDQTSLAIRFAPDGVACIGKIPRSFYIEAKRGSSIEKNAWIQYGKLVEAGNVLVIVFCNNENSWYFNFYESVKLIDGKISSENIPEYKRWPIDDDGWICPRESASWNEDKLNIKHASGTPYKKVDFSSLIPFAEFKNVVIERLRLNV